MISKIITAIVVLQLVVSPEAAYGLQDNEASSDLIIEYARGLGRDEESARKNALKLAVEQAIGVYVQAKEEIKIDGSYVEEIATFSNGFIERYQQHDLKKVGNLFEVVVLAHIRRGKLIQDLQAKQIALKPGVTAVQVDLSAPANRIRANRERMENASQLLAKFLEDIPDPKVYLRAGIISVVEQEVSQQQSRAHYDFIVRVDFEYQYDWPEIIRTNKWLDECMTQSKIASRSETESFRHDVDIELSGKLSDEFDILGSLQRLRLKLPAGSAFHRSYPGNVGKDEGNFLVGLMVAIQPGSQGKPWQTEWRMHWIEDEIWTKATQLARDRFYRRNNRAQREEINVSTLLVSLYGQDKIARENFSAAQALGGPHATAMAPFELFHLQGPHPRLSLKHRERVYFAIKIEETDSASPFKSSDSFMRGGRRPFDPIIPWSDKVTLTWSHEILPYQHRRRWKLSKGDVLDGQVVNLSVDGRKLLIYVENTHTSSVILRADLSEEDQVFLHKYLEQSPE
ncbi:MAG: hypothetical protein KF752_09535 [Pirellulaceae bacterium]|nr:hypothetical protein [Pirellulaceae bacterium]